LLEANGVPQFPAASLKLTDERVRNLMISERTNATRRHAATVALPKASVAVMLRVGESRERQASTPRAARGARSSGADNCLAAPASQRRSSVQIARRGKIKGLADKAAYREELTTLQLAGGCFVWGLTIIGVGYLIAKGFWN
jgi:hypothetical protein